MYSLKEAAEILKIKDNILEKRIREGKVKAHDKCIDNETIDTLLAQRKKYIGYREYAMTLEYERFDANTSSDRKKYMYYLEDNEYFGEEIYFDDNLISTFAEDEEFFFLRSEIDHIRFRSEEFLSTFNMTGQEKVERLLNSEIAPASKLCIQRFLSNYNKKKIKYTPSLIEMVEIIKENGDVKGYTSDQIREMMECTNFETTKDLLYRFLNFTFDHESVKYKKLYKRSDKEERNSLPAYEGEQYKELSIMVYGDEKEDELTTKALDNRLYAELWLFIAIHYLCAWRASDICKKWVYPCLQKDNNFKINLDTLRQDIIEGHVPEETYVNITNYILKKIEIQGELPGKNSAFDPSELQAKVTPEVRSFLGKLILIAECHHYSTGEGYMKANRVPQYCNWVNLQSFFGREYVKTFGKRNLHTRMLNKCYLQSIVVDALNKGKSPIVAHMLASLARNHKNINTTSIYLKDQALTGEDAGAVLYMMMERGVMSSYYYQQLLTAFPDVFPKLTKKQQTKLIKFLNTSAYELEMIGHEYNAKEKIKEAIEDENYNEAQLTLKAMYEIGNGYGRSKSKGIHCVKTAIGELCEYPADKCLISGCQWDVFTNRGIPALIEVFNDLRDKYERTKNEKYKDTAKKLLMKYKDILYEIMKEATREEKTAVIKLLKEGIE